jgi:hypothetical protein
MTPPVRPNSRTAGDMSRKQFSRTRCNAGSAKSPRMAATGAAKISRSRTMIAIAAAMRVSMALAMRASSPRCVR